MTEMYQGMDPSPQFQRTVFLGGSARRASVRIRCVQIAEALGIDYVLDTTSLDDVPHSKSVFVCVKPGLSTNDLVDLSQRGLILWDVHDEMPPSNLVNTYIVGSGRAESLIRPFGTTVIIPHHHCNFSGRRNRPHKLPEPIWLGRPYWFPPELTGLAQMINANEMCLEEIIATYRNMGLAVNARRETEGTSLHIDLNDGGKLLNCFGFGIPSVSYQEPAYAEFGDGATIFCTAETVVEVIRSLIGDEPLRARLSEEAFERGRPFHIAKIAPRYKELLEVITQNAK